MKLHSLIPIKATPNLVYSYLVNVKKQQEWLPELIDIKLKRVGQQLGFEATFLEDSKINKKQGLIHENIKGKKLIVELFDNNINAKTCYFLQKNSQGFCDLTVTVKFTPARKIAILIMPLIFLYGNYFLGKRLRALQEVVESAT
ncbi:hypothetical protein HPDP_00932 [Candidatus Hepatincola sp. Pdp]